MKTVKAYAVQMSFDVPESEKRVAEKAVESFKELISLIKLANNHLNLIYEPFKNLSSLDIKTLLEYRTTLRGYRDRIKENYDEILQKAHYSAILMSEFANDTAIIEMMNAFLSAQADLETQVNRLLSIFSDLSSNEFKTYLLAGIDAVRKEANQVKQLVNDRILSHIETNILAKNWVSNITDEYQRKVYQKVPLLIELYKERQEALQEK